MGQALRILSQIPTSSESPNSGLPLHILLPLCRESPPAKLILHSRQCSNIKLSSSTSKTPLTDLQHNTYLYLNSPASLFACTQSNQRLSTNYSIFSHHLRNSYTQINPKRTPLAFLLYFSFSFTYPPPFSDNSSYITTCDNILHFS